MTISLCKIYLRNYFIPDLQISFMDSKYKVKNFKILTRWRDSKHSSMLKAPPMFLAFYCTKNRSFWHYKKEKFLRTVYNWWLFKEWWKICFRHKNVNFKCANWSEYGNTNVFKSRLSSIKIMNFIHIFIERKCFFLLIPIFDQCHIFCLSFYA